jgi:hypothetical protein
MKKQKQPIIHVMLKHYFCKYTIDRDTLFWGSYSLSFICGHIGLCAFTFILVDQFCIMFYPCPSVFPSVMFWFPFNNLSLPWTWSNVLKFGCVKNHKRPVNFDFYKSRGIYVPCSPSFFHFIIFFAGKIQN